MTYLRLRISDMRWRNWLMMDIVVPLLALVAAGGSPAASQAAGEPPAATGRATAKAPLEFQLTFAQAVSDKPFTGRVYVMLSKNPLKAVPNGPNWFKPEPFFARDVKNWKPDEPINLGPDCLAHPEPLPRLAKGTWYVQAILDFDRHISFSAADGNGYSQPIQRELNPAESGMVSLRIDQVYKEKAFVPTARVKLVDIESKLLSAFHHRPIRLRAGVVLPASFAEKPQRRYPVIYEVPGFGGNHFGAFRAEERKATEVAGVEMLYVVLDPSCRLGHHVFADSDNNGPYGRALIEELIPAIEKEYRGLGSAAGRFVTGHSSGGWSSLWLQVTYPDHFGGVWSTAPDPVDFRDFQRIDLVKPDANMFTDPAGKPRPIARRAGKAALWYKEFSDMEVVMGHGGQLASFEAVFSQRGPDGQPKKLWNRGSGDIDPEVARSWERYDIRHILEKNWKTLGPKLNGKLHVYMGDEDSFYLEGAVVLLKQALKQLGSDALVEIFPNRNHGNLIDQKMRERIAQEMANRYRRLQVQAGQTTRTDHVED
jgi:enterochelin esterase-like enzyme